MQEEPYQVAVVFLDLREKPAIIKYGDEYQCQKCHSKFIAGYAPYVAYATDKNFTNELRKAEAFQNEVRYVYASGNIHRRQGKSTKFRSVRAGVEAEILWKSQTKNSKSF
jgi:hypothetical protein